MGYNIYKRNVHALPEYRRLCYQNNEQLYKYYVFCILIHIAVVTSQVADHHDTYIDIHYSPKLATNIFFVLLHDLLNECLNFQVLWILKLNGIFEYG